MREVKFRAWYVAEKVMIYSDEYEHDGVKLLNKFFYDIDGNDDVHLLQFTGHRDKNGKEIYEGDIIHVVNFVTTAIGTEPYDAIIEWDKYRWCMRNLSDNVFLTHFGPYPLNNLDPFGLDITVLGNRFENPQLIQGAKVHVD